MSTIGGSSGITCMGCGAKVYVLTTHNGKMLCNKCVENTIVKQQEKNCDEFFKKEAAAASSTNR